MADCADLANDLVAETLARALANRPQLNPTEVIDCVECGDEIHPERRRLLPGICLCIDCAVIADDEQKRGIPRKRGAI